MSRNDEVFRLKVETVRFYNRRGSLLKCKSDDLNNFTYYRCLLGMVDTDHDLTKKILNDLGGSNDITEINGYIYLVYDRKKYGRGYPKDITVMPKDFLRRIETLLDSKKQILN
jgi:hypothetical protein